MNENASFDEIHSKFSPAIIGYLSRIVGATDAEDLTQEVMLRVEKNLPRFEKRSSFSTWIYRIATNVALDHMRKKEERRRSSELPLNEFNTPATASNVEGESEDREFLQCVREFVASLPDNYRVAFILHEMEGYENRQIAELLGVSLATVKIHIHRARSRLKKKMEQGCCLYYDEKSRLACSRKG